jgi:hypothetical protein
MFFLPSKKNSNPYPRTSHMNKSSYSGKIKRILPELANFNICTGCTDGNKNDDKEKADRSPLKMVFLLFIFLVFVIEYRVAESFNKMVVMVNYHTNNFIKNRPRNFEFIVYKCFNQRENNIGKKNKFYSISFSKPPKALCNNSVKDIRQKRKNN